MRRSRSPLLVAASLVAACSIGGTAPDQGASPLVALDLSAAATPNFLEADPAAPAIANPVVSFWAKKGVANVAYMYYAARPGHVDSTVFLRFRVRKRSLAFYPNGQPVALGDSVLITATLVDPVNLVVDFQPAGLVFAASDPAALKLSYLETNPDWNKDGVVNSVDERLQKKFKIWEQHGALPFAPLVSKVTVGPHEVEAAIGGFTRYAVAY